MGISKNYFKNVFAKLKISKQSEGCSIKIDFERLGEKLDITQDVLDAQVWDNIKEYMPMDTGNLIEETDMLNKSTRGEVYLFPPDSDYGHYQYEGQLYVDPDTGSAWAKQGAHKIPAEPYTPLFYDREAAEAHWDEAAYQNHKKEWVQTVKNAMKG